MSGDLMTDVSTPFFIRRADESLDEYVVRVRNHVPSGPLFEDQDPRPSQATGKPLGRPKKSTP